MRSSRFRSQQLACETGGGLATDPYLCPTQATKAALRQAVCLGKKPTPKYKADLSPPIGRLLVMLQGDKSDRKLTSFVCLLRCICRFLAPSRPRGTSARMSAFGGKSGNLTFAPSFPLMTQSGRFPSASGGPSHRSPSCHLLTSANHLSDPDRRVGRRAAG